MRKKPEKLEKPDWYIVTVERISRYQQHVKIADSLREDVENLQPKVTINYSGVKVKTGLSDRTVTDAGRHIDNEIIYRSHDNEAKLMDFAISLLTPEKQFIVRKKFVEGKKDSEVSRLLSASNLGTFCDATYRKLKDVAISDLSKMMGYQRI